MFGALRRLRDARIVRVRAIPEPLWQLTLARFPFLSTLGSQDGAELRRLATLFLARKEFHGAAGFMVTDEVAVAVAAQACLPILKLGLQWYDGFVGVVMHADEVVARRETVDEDGVVHQYEEALAGEAMEGGPVMLSWRDVADAGESAADGYNVVIHEFAHVIDMRNGVADGLPALPGSLPRARWLDVLESEYEAFCEAVDEGEGTVLDPYGAESLEEFFAVAVEAFFVTAARMREAHPDLYALFAAFFGQDPAANADSSPHEKGGRSPL